jgi:hypothetical protein
LRIAAIGRTCPLGRIPPVDRKSGSGTRVELLRKPWARKLTFLSQGKRQVPDLAQLRLHTITRQRRIDG